MAFKIRAYAARAARDMGQSPEASLEIERALRAGFAAGARGKSRPRFSGSKNYLSAEEAQRFAHEGYDIGTRVSREVLAKTVNRMDNERASAYLAKRPRNPSKRRNPERLYHVVIRNDRTGIDGYLTVRPETHPHAVTIMSKQTPIRKGYPHLRYLLVEASAKTNAYAKAGEGPAPSRKSNPRHVSDDKAIRAFLAKEAATSKQLSSTGSKLSLHWPSATIAEWAGGQIQLGHPYGNVSQSYIKKVAKLAPAYLLTRDSWWALPAKTVKLLKAEGR